jgi:hypothetical protein
MNKFSWLRGVRDRCIPLICFYRIAITHTDRNRTMHVTSSNSQPKIQENTMKTLMIAIAFAGIAAAGSAFAADPTATATPPAATTQAGQWQAPYGQPIQPKTRAEVYQELVHAEQDGQLSYLNSTVYAHS